MTLSQVRHSYASGIPDDALGQIINIHTANRATMPVSGYKQVSPAAYPTARANAEASRPHTNASIFTSESLGHAKLSLKSNMPLPG